MKISTLNAAYVQDRQVFLTKNALYKCRAPLAETQGRPGQYAEAVLKWDRIATDPDLAPLRERDDFQQLLADLKKKAAAKQEK